MRLKTRISLGAMGGLLFVAAVFVVAGHLSSAQVEKRYQSATVSAKAILWKKIVASQSDQMTAAVKGLVSLTLPLMLWERSRCRGRVATQTAKATEEIGQQIAGMQGVTGDVVKAIEGIGKTIAGVNEIATGIAAAVEEQGAATQEIARNVQRAAEGTHEVNANIGDVTRAAGETGSAASQVLQSAGDLSEQSEALRCEVATFLTQVKAG